jgi:hypothetical protein
MKLRCVQNEEKASKERKHNKLKLLAVKKL